MKNKGIETEGWLLRVGDVYSNPFQYSHFKITELRLTSNESEDIWVVGERVHPENYSNVIEDADEPTEFRAWYLNDYFGLETPEYDTQEEF